MSKMLKVMIVEDELPVRNMIIDIVDWSSYDMEIAFAAADGQEALQYLEGNDVDVIMTDIYMPFVDGMELVRRVRQVNSDCKVIFLTGYNDFEFAREAVELKASKYLLKPITKKELVEVLEEVKSEIQDQQLKAKDLHRLQADYEKNKLLLQNNLFLDLIRGYIPADRIEEVCMNVGLGFNASNYVLCVLEVIDRDNIGQDQWFNDYSILHFALCNIVKEVLVEEPYTKVLMEGDGKIVILIEDDERRRIVNKAQRLMQRAIHTIKRLYDFDISVGISEPASGLHHLKRSFDEAMTAISYRVLEGNNRVIVKSDMNRSNSEEKKKSVKAVEPIIDGILVGDGDKTQTYISMLFDGIKFLKLDLKETKNLLLLAVSQIYEAFNGLVDEDHKAYMDLEFIQDLYGLHDYDHLKEKVKMISLEMMDVIGNLREKEKNDTIGKALSIMESSYSNPDFDLNGISEALSVSASYFSRLFKKITGKTFLEHLTEMRLGKAQELLKTTDLKVYEIAEKTGYEDAHYFSYNFRKNIGKTPLQYRKGK